MPSIIMWIVEVIPLWAKELIFALAAMVIGLAVGAHWRLRRRATEYRHQALHDPLTGLPNRTLFRERVTQALRDVERDGSQIAVMLIDLDGFKEVNDTLGHTSGDRLLGLVASRLTGAIRAGDTVARLGGDEFAVLLPRVPNEDAATVIADALRSTLQKPSTVGDLSIHTDASIGIAMGPQHGKDTDTLIQHADVAMYLAKEARAGTAVYETERDHYSPERLTMIGELRDAIALDQFALYYQPQIEPETGRVDGVEALIRWHHPERGLVSPDAFVPIAERTGLIRPLTLWVLEAAIRQCAAWRRSGLDLRVAVNLSASSLVDADTPDAIERFLRLWALPPGYLQLEITETTAMADPARTFAVLARLDALGVDLSVDDFGTGYSSLAYLRRLPVRELKIDRSFVSNMATDPNDKAIVLATIDLGHNLGLRVVAEGVEDEDTLRELTCRGCDLVQGYLFSKPLPPAELECWLAARRGAETPDEPCVGDPQSPAPSPGLPVLAPAALSA